MKSLRRSRLLAEPVALWAGHQAGAAHEEPQPVAGTDIQGEVNEQLYLMGEIPQFIRRV